MATGWILGRRCTVDIRFIPSTAVAVRLHYGMESRVDGTRWRILCWFQFRILLHKLCDLCITVRLNLCDIFQSCSAELIS